MAKMHEAILHIYPKAEFTFLEDDYTTLQWFSKELLKPTLGDIVEASKEVDRIKAIAALDEEYEAKFVAIKDKLFNAMILDDQEEITALKAEYATLKQELGDKKSALQG